MQWLMKMFRPTTHPSNGVNLAEWDDLKYWYLAHWHQLQVTPAMEGILEEAAHTLQTLASGLTFDNGRTMFSLENLAILRQLRECIPP